MLALVQNMLTFCLTTTHRAKHDGGRKRPNRERVVDRQLHRLICDGIPFRRGKSMVMLLDEAMANLECQIVRHHDGVITPSFIAEVEQGALGEARPLLYFRGSYAQLAH